MKWLRRLLLLLFVLALGPALTVACGNVKLGQNWRTADRTPAGIAPNSIKDQAAIVQIYAARAFNWRGIFAVHTWIATKEAGAQGYEVHQVVGWREWQGLPVVVSHVDSPDRHWYGRRTRSR